MTQIRIRKLRGWITERILAAVGIVVLLAGVWEMSMSTVTRAQTTKDSNRRIFFGDGLFDWQMPVGQKKDESWEKFNFDAARWWGTFPQHEKPAVRGAGED